jgi:hypothetical protein
VGASSICIHFFLQNKKSFPLPEKDQYSKTAIGAPRALLPVMIPIQFQQSHSPKKIEPAAIPVENRISKPS